MRAYDSEVCSACVCEILPVRVYVTAMYVARVRSGVSVKSGNSGIRLALVEIITNTNHRRTKDKIGQIALDLRSN